MHLDVRANVEPLPGAATAHSPQSAPWHPQAMTLLPGETDAPSPSSISGWGGCRTWLQQPGISSGPAKGKQEAQQESGWRLGGPDTQPHTVCCLASGHFCHCWAGVRRGEAGQCRLSGTWSGDPAPSPVPKMHPGNLMQPLRSLRAPESSHQTWPDAATSVSHHPTQRTGPRSPMRPSGVAPSI